LEIAVEMASEKRIDFWHKASVEMKNKINLINVHDACTRGVLKQSLMTFIDCRESKIEFMHLLKDRNDLILAYQKDNFHDGSENGSLCCLELWSMETLVMKNQKILPLTQNLRDNDYCNQACFAVVHAEP
jgi:hypothetical protein